ncbi:MAG: hypothetical protein GY821_05970 [Gammaproteobacteria bacterium]|nr:hypothetical protein [Gammaproteobacteria bacterium]
MRKLAKFFKQTFFLVVLLTVFIEVRAATVTPIVLSPAGATKYDARQLEQVTDSVMRKKTFAAQIPITLVAKDGALRSQVIGHCQIFNKATFDWFLHDTMHRDSKLYHNSILPLIAQTEQFLLQSNHYQFHFIFLCSCSRQGGNIQSVIFKKNTRGERVNLTAAQNSSGRLVVLTQSPSALVLFGSAAQPSK